MNKYKKITLIILLSLTVPVFATERIERLSSQTHYGTIVRDAGGNTSIICDQHNSSLGAPKFSMITMGLSNSPNFVLQNIDTVYDFEIFGDTVYFCGVKSNVTGGYGVIGYFPLSGFTSGYIYYLNVPLFRRVKKLEVGIMTGYTHLVAVGDGISGKAELLDAINLGTSWSMHFFDAPDDLTEFTDLAIIDTYVVVSSLVRSDFLRNARVYYFKKPVPPDSSLSPISVTWIDIREIATNNTIIEACEGNAYVVAITNAENLIGTSSFTFVAYDGLNYITTNLITENYNHVSLKDIKYYAKDQILEVLFNIQEGSMRESVIYNLTPAMQFGNDTSQGHLFYDVNITSLDQSTFYADHFIASGINPSSIYNVEHYLYKYDLWRDCTKYTSNLVKKVAKYEKTDKLNFGEVTINQNPDSVDISVKNDTLTKVCISSK